MKLNLQDIAHLEKVEEERMAGQFYRLYFNRMAGIDMEIASAIYNRLLRMREGHMMPANNWFKTLNT